MSTIFMKNQDDYTKELSMSQGGKREGAGRKPLAPEQRKLNYGTKLSQDVINYLRSRENAAAELDTTVRRSKNFRIWLKENR